MAEKKPSLTLGDLLNQDSPATNGQTEQRNSPLGDREAIEKRTRFMRDKTGSDTNASPVAEKPLTNSTEELEPEKESVNNGVDLKQYIVKQTANKAKPDHKTASKATDDKVTRSIQFSRATYRQIEKTLNFIAYKSGQRNVSFPKYFEKLHEMARQNPDLMNQLIDHFKTDLPD